MIYLAKDVLEHGGGIMDRKDIVRETLAQYNQEHLLMKYDELGENEQRKLLDSIEEIDFELMERLYKKATEPIIEETIKVEPIDYIDKEGLTNSERIFYSQIGKAVIKEGTLAVVTMAGGQGTRLGHNGPKGTFVFDPETGKTIFEALTDTMKKACDEYHVAIPWYIMTSKENNEATIKFFEEHHYFGYKGDVQFFVQGELPMLDFNGKILLDRNYQVKKAANGHGGTLFSIEKCGILDDMKARGIKWVSINGVDNVLVKPVDPLFIGISSYNNVMGAVKTISKTNPEEKVGVICRKNGRVGVVEYTEISKKMAELRNSQGKLVYGDAYVLFNLYSIEGLERVAEISLPYHIAVKKADYYDANGNWIQAEAPNSYKFEMFIFDAYEMFDVVCVLRVLREDEFAPIKNAKGQDSPETALKMYKAYKCRETGTD